MATFRQLHSILLKDNKKLPVTFMEWGTLTLTGAELTEFQTDMANLLAGIETALQSGDLVIENINESFTSAEGYTFEVLLGTLSYRYGNLINPDPIKVKWEQRMQQDSNILVFNPEIEQA